MKRMALLKCLTVFVQVTLLGCTFSPDPPQRVSMFDRLIDESTIKTSPQAVIEKASQKSAAIVLSENTTSTIDYMKEHAEKSANWNPILRSDLKKMNLSYENPENMVDKLVIYFHDRFRSVEIQHDMTSHENFDVILLVDLYVVETDWFHSTAEARLTTVVFDGKLARIATVDGYGSAVNPRDGSQEAYTTGIRSRDMAVQNFQVQFSKILR